MEVGEQKDSKDKKMRINIKLLQTFVVDLQILI